MLSLTRFNKMYRCYVVWGSLWAILIPSIGWSSFVGQALVMVNEHTDHANIEILYSVRGRDCV